MRLVFVLAVTAACLALACSGEEEPGASTKVAPAVGDPGVRLQTPPVGAAPLPAAGDHDYACADGTTFRVRISEGDAVMTLQGNTLKLEHSEQAAGAQYAGEGVVYVAQGNEAVLERAGAAPVRCTAK
jgi:membrane-bound inhibitor of C-type lysozyme